MELFIAEAGEGPLVVLSHGWPECWYSWRHQLSALADAGFHAVAPDQRGYGGSTCPPAVDDYTVFHLVGALVGRVEVMGQAGATLVGHDWGGQVAWVTAGLHPDRVVSLAVLSRPHPRAFLRSLRATGDEQQQRSRHHRAYQRPEATDELLADDAARLRDALKHLNNPKS